MFTLRRLARTPLRRIQNLYRLSSTTVKPYYVTTPIFYPNAPPHIGHLHSLLAADFLARFRRLTHPSEHVNFLTGTDEHGLKIQKAAKEAGLEGKEKEFCDSISQRFRELAEKANISHTRFIRTTEAEHHSAVSHLWTELAAKGFIYQDMYEGWYSISDECFYTDVQVKRVSEPGAAKEKWVSIETGSEVSYSSEETYKFKLSALQPALLEHFISHPGAIYPETYYDEVVRQLSAPNILEDLSISRPRSRLEWGVRVPGDDTQTIYVWIDALCNYLTGAGYPWPEGDEAKHGWPVDVQIIGKDILRFHAIYFPALLIALSLPLPQTLLTHAHWTLNQKKMSKSTGNTADPIDALDTFGVDGVRWYIARVGGRGRNDVDWSEGQAAKHLVELCSLLGNYFLRITSKAITSKLPPTPLPLHCRHHPCFRPSTKTEVGSPLSEVELQSQLHNTKLLETLRMLGGKVRGDMEKFELSQATEHIVDVLSKANNALSRIEPWTASCSPILRQTTYLTALEVLRVVGVALQPIVPDTATTLLDALLVKEDERTWEFTELGCGSVRTGNHVRPVIGVTLVNPVKRPVESGVTHTCKGKKGKSKSKA